MDKNEEIKKRLLEQNLTIKAWCKAHNFSYESATAIINRYSSGKLINPKAQRSFDILKQIKKDTGIALCAYLQ